MMRLKVKSYSIMLLLSMIILISMITGCSMPQGSTDKQSTNQKSTSEDKLNASLYAGPQDQGLCNIICRWRPEGGYAFLVYDPELQKIVIRPYKNTNDMLNLSWQWSAVTQYGRIAFYNVKYGLSIYYKPWLSINALYNPDDDEYDRLDTTLDLSYSMMNGGLIYFDRENQQIIDGHLFENLTVPYTDCYTGYGKHVLNCESYLQTGYPVYYNTLANENVYPNWRGWWSAQWWISYYTDSDD